MDPITYIVGIVILVVVLLSIFLSFVPVGLWISALASGVHVGWGTLIGMKIRRIQPKRLVYPLIKATKAGLKLTISQLETHFLAGGNITASSTPLLPPSAPISICPSRRPAPSTWPAATCSKPCR